MMNTKKSFFITLLVLSLILTGELRPQDNLSRSKMKRVTSEILQLFVDGRSDELKKYISRDWLDDKEIKLSKYKINNYSPDEFEVVFMTVNVSIARISGKTWSHLLLFKFTDEDGSYRVIPRGISTANDEYIDPWWDVKVYICSTGDKD